MRDYRLYLKDILAAIESIEQFVAGMDLQAFKADDKTASAVIKAYPEVPWKEMAGMRD